MKYKSCNLLAEGAIEFRYNGIALCQRVDHVGGGDIVVGWFDDKEDKDIHFDLDKYMERKMEVVEQNKSGQLYHKCVGCVELQDREWPEITPQIFQIILHHWTKCNSHCVYCYTNKDKEYFNNRNCYQIYPLLEKLAKRDLIRYGGICTWAGGEVSCLPEFEKVVKFLSKYDYVPLFNSSCVKFEKTIAKHLEKGNGLLVVSIDAGTRETHLKIKQLDTYEKVWKNMAKYAKKLFMPSLLFAKYIVVKDINDNEEEIIAFLKKVKESGCKHVLMEIDHYYFCDNRDNIPKYIRDLFYFAYEKATEMGLVCQIYSNSSVFLQQGQWADVEFWHGKVFDAGHEIEHYAYRPVYRITSAKKTTKYEDIRTAACSNGLTYLDVWNACEKTRKKKNFKINDNYYFYASDIELNYKYDFKKSTTVKEVDWKFIESVMKKRFF